LQIEGEQKGRQPGSASVALCNCTAGSCKRPVKERIALAIKQQFLNSIQWSGWGVNLSTCWARCVSCSGKQAALPGPRQKGENRHVPGEEGALTARLTPPQPQRPSGMWEKVRSVPTGAQPSVRSRWARKRSSLGSKGKLRLM